MSDRSITEVLTDLNIATAYHRDAIVDVVTKDNFISSRLLKKSKAVSGGKKIEVVLDYGTTNAQTMGEYDQINLVPEDELDAAYFEWAWLNDTMTLSEKKGEIQNMGREQLINLMEHKAKKLSRTFKDKFSTLLFSTTKGTKDPENLYTIIGTQDNTVGGIDASDTTLPYRWNPYILDLSSATPTFANLIDPASNYYIEKILRAIYDQLSVGSDTPTIAVCNQVVWDAYEAVLRADKRFDSKYNQKADAGFDTLAFRNMLIAVDDNVPGGALDANSATTSMMYVLNEDYLGFRHKKGKDFTNTPWKKPDLQHVYFSEMNWWGAFICSRRDKQGCVKGLPISHGSSLTVS